MSSEFKPSYLKSDQPEDSQVNIENAWIVLQSQPNVISMEFLQSKTWKRLRYQALKLHGNRCQCCGLSPSNGAVLNVDHILPRKLFPENALQLENLQVLCGD